jgi:hypothetical protein
VAVQSSYFPEKWTDDEISYHPLIWIWGMDAARKGYNQAALILFLEFSLQKAHAMGFSDS